MAWNDGKERKKFEREQAELREIYLANGMTEEQIQAMYDFDKSLYNQRRRNAMHTQSFDFETFEGETADEGQNPLYDKFLEKLSVEIDCSYIGRFSWIEEIENEQLAKAIKTLSEKDLEILTLLYVNRLSQREIATHFGVKEAAMSRKIARLKSFIKNFSN